MLSKSMAAVFVAVLLAGSAAIETAYADPAPTLLWQRRPGTAEGDQIYGVATDKANAVIVVGLTEGSMAKTKIGDESDGFIVKYAADGRLLWRRQPGTRSWDYLQSVAVDAANNIVAIGKTTGWWAGQNQGRTDLLVVKYGPDGLMQWKRQVGTTKDDDGYAVTTDVDGNIIVVGCIGAAAYADAFILKYAPDGTELWRRMLATPEHDCVTAVTTRETGEILIAGTTSGNLAGPLNGTADMFLAVYSADGTLQWIRQPGLAGTDSISGIAAAKDGTLFVAGRRSAALPRGALQVHIASYSADGTAELWRREFGGYGYDGADAINLDLAGNIVVTGLASSEPFMASYTPTGTLLWKQGLNVSNNYPVVGATDTVGGVIVAATVPGAPGRGWSDGFVAKYGYPAP